MFDVATKAASAANGQKVRAGGVPANNDTSPANGAASSIAPAYIPRLDGLC